MKKWKRGSVYFKCGMTAFLVIAASISFYYLMFHGQNIKTGFSNTFKVMMPLIFGLAIAYLLTPVLNYVEYRLLKKLFDKLKIKETPKSVKLLRALSMIITMVLFIALIYGLINMIISQILPSIEAIAADFDNYVNDFTKWLNKLLENNPTIRDFAIKNINTYSKELENWFNDTLLKRGSDLLKTLSMSVLVTFKVLWNLIIGIIISIYLMGNKEKFAGQSKKIIYALFSKPTANIIINNVNFTHRTFSGFISGKVLDSILIGCLCFVGTTILQTPYAALVSVIIGVTNIVPFFGPFLGAIPSVLLIFLVDMRHPLNCVYFIIFILILQQFDGNVLGPIILGDSTGLTSFWVIFAITFFGGFWGIFGMIVGVPLFAVIYAAVKSFINVALEQKELPVETDRYIRVCAVDDDGFHEYTPEYMLPKNEEHKDGFGTKYICHTGLGEPKEASKQNAQ